MFLKKADAFTHTPKFVLHKLKTITLELYLEVEGHLWLQVCSHRIHYTVGAFPQNWLLFQEKAIPVSSGQLDQRSYLEDKINHNHI